MGVCVTGAAGGIRSWDEECFHMVIKSMNTWTSATNLWLRGAAFLEDNSGGMHRVRAAGNSQEVRPLLPGLTKANWDINSCCSGQFCASTILCCSKSIQ